MTRTASLNVVLIAEAGSCEWRDYYAVSGWFVVCVVRTDESNRRTLDATLRFGNGDRFLLQEECCEWNNGDIREGSDGGIKNEMPG